MLRLLQMAPCGARKEVVGAKEVPAHGAPHVARGARVMRFAAHGVSAFRPSCTRTDVAASHEPRPPRRPRPPPPPMPRDS